MSNLQLVTTGNFDNAAIDVYSRNDEMYMTINQLAQALGYNNKNGVEKIISRNQYLTEPEFSTTDKMTVVEGKRKVTREMRLFTEDGIYEVSFLSNAPKARLFRAWVRKLIKAYRRGTAVNPETSLEARISLLERRLNVGYTLPLPKGQKPPQEPVMRSDDIFVARHTKKIYSVKDLMEILTIGRNGVLNLLHSGRIRFVRVGRRILIPAGAVDEFIKD